MVPMSTHGRVTQAVRTDSANGTGPGSADPDPRFQGLLEAAPDAIVCVDSGGRIVLLNGQAERLFGYRRDELIGHDVDLLVPEAARGVHSGHRSTYVNDPLPRPMGAGMQLAGRRKDGGQFPAEISLSSIETNEGLLVSAAIRDITDRLQEQAERERLRAEAERERLERQLHQSQRLESLGQLAGGVAHDFNNLLGVILNYSSFVSQEISARADKSGEDWAAVRSDLDEIQRAAERASKLTHQLLAFGRREVVQPVVLGCNDVIRDIERLLERTLGEHIELVAELSDHLDAVMADPGQLEQVLVNLAVNARDAMPAGGKLLLESRNVIVDEQYVARRPLIEPGRYVRLRVSDTGTGMDRETIVRAFEPFFTTKPKGEGSGLGLATVYGIVKQAGGDVEIYSEKGLGTTVSILLPATKAVSPEPSEPAPAQSLAGNETVLVVEDEDAMRELTRRILTRHGYSVIVAGRGEEATRLAWQHAGPIDLLLTDVVMPQMLGKEVVERVSAVRPGIRALYMSGYAQPILTSQGTLEAGVTLVEKPFSEPMLLAKLREVLDAPERGGRER
jgi:PAS domain S-box-containing protein